MDYILQPVILKEDFINIYPLIKKIKFTDMEPADCLCRCLLGKYKGYIGYKKNIPVGIITYYIFDSTNCFVVGLWVKNNFRSFKNLFFEEMKKKGIEKIRCSTSLPEKAYGRLTGMNRLWSVFEIELNGGDSYGQ